ncbi:preprotein translocase subunit SecE [Zwartia panacis]|jgi:preprotein translocase subunit SecE|uniref:preprotein translocase subunit SecE n=1 Tax=Zwartia panacis TaxID=2683345 RepID=UPI0025B509D8|nr:preprotein translocase subunit SecE [Zwartia panacis]MDN4018428.1 preprotein translocase subunit SecE [Zwartia panacis]
MSNTTIENVTSTADRLKLALAVLVIIAGIVGFSMLESKIPLVGRIAVFIGSLILAAIIAWFSEPGRRTIAFAQDSYNEVRRVVWPTRKETMQMTGIVFAFVAVMGLFLWVLDKLIAWLLFGVLLGWK